MTVVASLRGSWRHGLALSATSAWMTRTVLLRNDACGRTISTPEGGMKAGLTLYGRPNMFGFAVTDLFGAPPVKLTDSVSLLP